MVVVSLLVGLALILSPVLAGALPIKESRGTSGEVAAVRKYFYVGGSYVNTSSGHLFSNQMYVEKLAPLEPCQPYPLIFIHGQAQTGTVRLPSRQVWSGKLKQILELAEQTRRWTWMGDILPGQRLYCLHH
jgi:hypothetical protein